MTNQSVNPTHKAVREYYGRLAKEGDSCCQPSAEAADCCGTATGETQVQNDLYPQELLAGIPLDVVNFTAGSGDPISAAKLREGETVLDLGSGGGLDCFLAARQVGGKGRVIGVDMTPEMLNRARSQVEKLSVRNVEFREGFLEALPVQDESVDVIISNCVINLSPDKPQVFREMYRVLKPGGRIAVSDPVSNRPLPEAEKKGDDWCGCVSGALDLEQYKEELGRAGFVEISIEPNAAIVEKAYESGQLRNDRKVSKEQVLADLQNWEKCPATMIVPGMVTARKAG